MLRLDRSCRIVGTWGYKVFKEAKQFNGKKEKKMDFLA